MSDFNEKIYGVHWEVEKPYPRWQLTSQNYLRVDVTGSFGAKYRIVAYTDLNDDAAESLRKLIQFDIISADSCGQEGFKGWDEEDLFAHVKRPGESSQWRVTNNAHILPGMKENWTRETKFADSLMPHPQDGYVVQFNAVPWDILKRYWRKPIHLDRQFHGRKRGKWAKHGFSSGVPAIEVLDFDLSMLRERKCFLADFSFMWRSRTRLSGAKCAMWMLEHTRAFTILTDEESPFTRSDDEVMFTLEHM